MSINQLPKEKRNQVILVCLVTLAVTAGWAFVVLKSQLDAKLRAEQTVEKRRHELARMSDKLKQAGKIGAETDAAADKMAVLESGMANDSDTFSWIVTTVREFKQSFPKVELPQFSQVTTEDNTLIPKFPYKQASVSVAGAAYYNDLGLFIANFENQFPYARIINLDIEPSTALNSTEREKLNFKMVIVFLVKSAKS